MEDLPQNKKIILFDGVCNLCDATVQFIIKHDKKDVFRFVPIQSDLGQSIIQHIGIDTSKTDSIILYEPGHAYYYKAEAALKIATALGGIYSGMAIFTILPKGLSNAVYDYIARNRYKWYGKKNDCMIPTPEMKAKFL
ncbi:thiol-disulfide oxidoreductase DCC family protein [Flavobacterium subsaxonicum]|uniref:Thiol-disulfide oxidoreductase n=1 Tax=Flavobacterium subsaxonicum WB 4.1-42 = DSM 21790 TaxID=1121898 RepID=A0A0A2MR81_9FLAO|nr:thiol-disulfide oxidoreductase DCC family protein [Flavobacterium subsaxonicum]KGO94854.1 thiol-disulfide oxidoreductase [Flavobacterium subsaxonicum WB 4.1-42 = DSM 21790]